MTCIDAVLRCVSDAIVLVDANGLVSHATQSACSMAGMSEAEFLNTRFDELIDAHGAASLKLLLGHGRPDQQARFESAFKASSAGRSWGFSAIKLADGGVCVRLREVGQLSLEARYDRSLLSSVTVDHATDMMIWVNRDGFIVFANASAKAHFAKLGTDLRRRPIYEIDPSSSLEMWRDLQLNLDMKKRLRFEGVNQVGPNEFVPVDVSVTQIEFDGEHYGCTVFYDISARKRLERELADAHSDLQKLANTDALSGIPNRRCFDRRLEEEFQHHLVSGLPLSLILIDIDAFKPYNDTYGHVAGDDCLKRVADALRRSACREFDVVARFGGEEFACILPSTSMEAAEAIAQRMREAIITLGIAHEASSVAPFVTASFGVATKLCLRHGGDLRLIEAADACLYEAKSLGRNRVVSRNITQGPDQAAVA